MNASGNKRSASRSTARTISLAAVAVALLGAGVYWLAQDRNGPAPGASAPQGQSAARQAAGAAPQTPDGAPASQCKARDLASLDALAKGEVAAMRMAKQPEALPAFSFEDGAGATKTLADYRGRVVLLNLWATWCAPCKLEMPALNALQGALGGKDFEVLAINMDSRDAGKPREWLQQNNIDRLNFYADTPGKIFQALRGAGRASGLPVTLLIDRDGCLLGQLDGAAEWHSEDAKALVRGALGG